MEAGRPQSAMEKGAYCQVRGGEHKRGAQRLMVRMALCKIWVCRMDVMAAAGSHIVNVFVTY